MKKINPKASQPKALKSLNKSISSHQSSSSVSLCNPSAKTIQSETLIKPPPLFDKQLITSMIKQQILTLQFQINETKQHLFRVQQQFKQDKQSNQITLNQFRNQICELFKRTVIEQQQQSRVFNIQYTPDIQVQNKKIKQVETNVATLFQKLDILTEDYINFKNICPPNQIQMITQSIQQVQIQINTISRSINKQIAELRDQFTEVYETLDSHINTVGNKVRLLDIEQNINSLTDKINILGLSSEKENIEIEKIQRQIDLHQTLIEKYEYREAKLKESLTTCIDEAKLSIQTQSKDLEQFLCLRLGKMIESYNNNFEQMDRSILDLKETIREVLYLNKFISQNIGQKLKNTIDNNTFNQTIANLNEKFSETYQLNYDKIVELNTKQYQVQNELSYMKTMLENLKMDFKHNYNVQKLDQDLSIESSQYNNSMEQSKNKSAENKKKFVKPHFVFPERDSFNFNEERKRKSMGMDVDEVRRFTLKVDKDN